MSGNDPRARARRLRANPTPGWGLAAGPARPLSRSRYLECPHGRPLDGVTTCRDRWCSVRQVVACRESDCAACPIPAGRLLEGPRTA